MDKVRFGIIGCGAIANEHAAALRSLPHADIVSCCDINPSVGVAFSRKWAIPNVYTSALALLSINDVDAVCVCTPHPQHADAIYAAVDRGVHVLTEKPFTTTVEDADRIIQRAARRKAVVSVVSQRRWLPAARRLRDLLDSGGLGDHIILGSSYCEEYRTEADFKRASWRGTWVGEGGGVLMNQSPHNIDFLLWYMGTPVEVFGYWANLTHPYIEVDDTVIASIKFASGALATFHATLGMNPKGVLHGVTLLGSNGLSASFDCRTYDTGENTMWPKNISINCSDAYVDPSLPNLHAYQIKDFIQALQEGRPPAVSAEDGRNTVRIIQGIYESSRTGKAVDLREA